jgi:hypothetical protein
MRYLRSVALPALWCTLLMATAFVGIGGLSLEGAGASDLAIQRLWKVGGLLTIATFVTALVIFAKRKRTKQVG